jgi:superoxide dismutase, Cu-Zn family
MKSILFLALLSTPALADKPADKPKPAEPLTIKIIDGKTGDVGTATLKPDPKGGVSIALDLHGLPPGEHAIHIHETAKCQVTPGEGAFKSAGAHFNPENKHHGLENKEGPHAGDMKNFTVDAKGKAKATVTASNVTMEDGPHSVFTNGGTALVIHAKADDMKTDPAGNAGDRIACGEITRDVKIVPKKDVKDIVQPVHQEKEKTK